MLKRWFKTQSQPTRPDGPCDDNPAVIQMRQVVKIFHTPAGEFTALKSIDLDIYRGEFISVTGKSGSGKSTLANMITGIDRPTTGDVSIGGTLVNRLNESDMARWRGRNLGIVFQFYQLLPMLSLLENVMLPMDFSDQYDPVKREELAQHLLARVGLQGLEHKMPAAISGGQQQAAAIARALANDPPFLIADEPTGNLDSRTAEKIFELFHSLSDQGKTIIMVTHDPGLAKRTSRQVVLADGQILNHWVVRTFPALNHNQMLRAGQHLQTHHIEPGQTILHAGQPVPAVYIITAGAVDILVDDKNHRQQFITRLEAGDHFGEVEMLHQPEAIATVRASDEAAVELLSLRRETFLELLQEAKTWRETMTHTIQERVRQNLSIRGVRHETLQTQTTLA